MAKENVNIGKVLDTCRKKGLCIISNAPLWTSIDSHMRAMGHLIVETLKISKKYQVVVSKFHRLQTNPLTGKTYRHTMRRKGRDVNRLVTKMPNKETWDNYEMSKDIFMDELYKMMEFKQSKKKKKLEEEMGIVKPKIEELSERELEVHRLFNIQKLTQREVAKIMGVSDSWVKQLRDKIKEKCGNAKENEGFEIKKAPVPLIE